jgi:type IV secretory pathway TrbF-like protein
VDVRVDLVERDLSERNGWLVHWREVANDANSQRGMSRWVARCKVRTRTAADGMSEAEIKRNPAGIVVYDLQWTPAP